MKPAADPVRATDPWLILTVTGPGVFDGIGDFSGALAESLRAYRPTELVVRRESWSELDAIDPARTAGVLVQYFPQAFMRGDLRHILRWLARVREAGRPVVITVHEFWPPLDGTFRRAIAQWLFRRTLRSLVRTATVTVVTYPHAIDVLALAVRAERAEVIPVGSTVLPIGPRDPDPDGCRVVMFGQPAALDAGVLRAVSGWLQRTPSASLDWLARSAEEMRAHWTSALQLPVDRVTFSGGLPAEDVSRHLRRGCVAIAPSANGASTRRSGFIALLAHGLPVVATDGITTPPALRQSGACVWAPEGQPDAFVAELDALVRDPARQAASSSAALAFFAEQLSWSAIAAAYARALTPV